MELLNYVPGRYQSTDWALYLTTPTSRLSADSVHRLDITGNTQSDDSWPQSSPNNRY